jgi:hypothetical protein
MYRVAFLAHSNRGTCRVEAAGYCVPTQTGSLKVDALSMVLALNTPLKKEKL